MLQARSKRTTTSAASSGPSRSRPTTCTSSASASTRRRSPSKAELLYDELRARGLDVLFDDRDESAGVKFNDADLLGMPVRLTVSPRSLEKGAVEMKRRDGADVELVPYEEAVERLRASK